MKKLILIFAVLFLSLITYGQKTWTVVNKLKVNDSIKFTKNMKGNTNYYFLTKDTITGLVYILPMDSIFSGEGLMWSDTATKLSTWTMDNLRLLKTDTINFLHYNDSSWVLSKVRAAEIYSTIADRIAGDKWGLVAAGSGYIKTLNSKDIITDSLFAYDSTRTYKYDDLSSSLFFGYDAGIKNTENGLYNTFIGNLGGNNNSNGDYNTFVGVECGRYNTIGNNNTFMGYLSGTTNTTGNYNTYIGVNSGGNNIGNQNVFLGNYAGAYVTDKSKLFIVNVFDHINEGGDTTKPLILGNFDSIIANQKITFNAHMKISNSLTIAGDTAFVKNDTTPSNGLATKLWTDNKFFTIANAALKLNISDTASLVLSKPRASQIYSTIADRIAGDKWGLVAAGSGYINVLNSKKIIATTLYTADSLEILTLASDNIKIGTGPSRAGTGVNNVFIGDANTGDAHTTGQSNVVIGAHAGVFIQAVSYNAFYGSYSGAASNGSYNAYFGPMSGRYMTTESYRIILNNIARGNKLGDTTLSPVYIYSSANMGDQIFYHNGNVVYTPTNTGDVVAGTGITKAMLNATMIYNGSSAIDISANPQIVAGTNGQRIMIIGTSDTNTLTLENGTGIVCPGTRVLGINDIWQAVFITGQGWVEISFNNN